MNFVPVKTSLLTKKLFPNYIWDIKTKDKTLYLTFDDGPTAEVTNWTLEQLKSYNAKATFFCIGNNIQKHPDIFKAIQDDGHAIGNHTQNHIKGWKTKTGDYIEEVKAAHPLFENKSTLFRPPYGQLKPEQGKQLLKLGYKIIMWDVLSFDWQKEMDKETCLNNVISKSVSGSIIVFHDSVKASKNLKYALPKVLEHFSNKGYSFQALD